MKKIIYRIKSFIRDIYTISKTLNSFSFLIMSNFCFSNLLDKVLVWFFNYSLKMFISSNSLLINLFSYLT